MFAEMVETENCRSLDLSSKQLSFADAAAIVEMLQVSQKLTNQQSPCMQVNRTLTSLDLGNNHFAEGISAISSALKAPFFKILANL